MPKDRPASELDVFKHAISSPLTTISCELEAFLLSHHQYPLPTGVALDNLLTNPHSHLPRALMATHQLINLVKPRTSTSLPHAKEHFHLASLLTKIFQTWSQSFPLIKESSFQIIASHYLYGNPHRLHLALSHLLNNAAESYPPSHPHKKILFHAFPCAIGALLLITDYGCGLTKAQLKKITNLNYSTKPHSQGIGLWEAHQIIHQEFSGNLCFTSVPNKGTTVGVFLPCEED
ncbi:HAMP domain-containing histidine kinase [Microgenomates group bacterium]|nr:HAMP domain-containing histidine kinase [Microgenomates group bacterium]